MDFKTNYYHVAPILLESGSVIKPGNWGRLIKKYRRRKIDNEAFIQLNNAYRESVLEEVRNAFYQDKPSRLNCIYLFDNLKFAISFRNKFYGHIIYKVEIIDTNALTHEGDMNSVDLAEGELIYDGMTELAHKYWSGNNIQIKEILVCSPVRVVSEISEKEEVKAMQDGNINVADVLKSIPASNLVKT